ncbi:hypothetical protein EJ08DRAFT_700233 [Tothia fuscella]|uniref:Uncharacterized protein n=1 Tax=Tothia fuscella TaxID=1048955 RepID=A0A9P4NLC1_9PEZI|nr:hypothetical protein EJ08DRAFT_700233 [Tothia fuscella]
MEEFDRKPEDKAQVLQDLQQRLEQANKRADTAETTIRLLKAERERTESILARSKADLTSLGLEHETRSSLVDAQLDAAITGRELADLKLGTAEQNLKTLQDEYQDLKQKKETQDTLLDAAQARNRVLELKMSEFVQLIEHIRHFGDICGMLEKDLQLMHVHLNLLPQTPPIPRSPSPTNAISRKRARYHVSTQQPVSSLFSATDAPRPPEERRGRPSQVTAKSGRSGRQTSSDHIDLGVYDGTITQLKIFALVNPQTRLSYAELPESIQGLVAEVVEFCDQRHNEDQKAVISRYTRWRHRPDDRRCIGQMVRNGRSCISSTGGATVACRPCCHANRACLRL